ncbi:MAG TPA: tetratricopeptide repeat protein, partial [Rariglobus sp.]
SATGRKRTIGILGLLALAALGMFSKENAAVLCGLMVLWDLCFGMKDRRELPARLPYYAAAIAPLIAFAILRRQIFSGYYLFDTNILDNPLLDLGFVQSRFMAIRVIGQYLWLLAFPLWLSSDRSYNQIPLDRMGDPMAWLSLVVVLGLMGVAIARYRRDRLLFWCAGLFGIALFPTSNLPMLIGTIAAERFLYMPGIAFAIAITALAFRWQPESRAAAVLGIVALLFTARTIARNPAWDSDFAIAEADVQSAPDSFRMHTLYGEVLYAQNPRANLDHAIREQETAWRILSGMPPAKTFTVTPASLGMLYGLKGDLAGGLSTAGGRSLYESSLTTLRAAAEASAVQQKQHDEREARRGNPAPMLIQYGAINFYLGQAYMRLGRFDEGIAYYRRGIARAPEDPAAYDALAQALFNRGDHDGAALAVLEKALVLGLHPDAVANVRAVYEKLPDGACAVRNVNGINYLDSTCPRLGRDLCKATAELEQFFRDGRKFAKAEEWRKDAVERYGCRR